MTNFMKLENQFSSGVYGKRDAVMVRGSGAALWDINGKEYIDCVGGIGVANIGHSHPRLVDALTRQASTLITCQEMFYNDCRAQLLERLAEITPGQLNRFFLCNSGAEAIEAAIKFARLSSGRAGIVATMRGFHGRTLGALSATHKAIYREPFMPLVPGFSHVPFNDIEAMYAAVNEDTAAVLVEVVQGEGGVYPGDPAYFQALRRLCDERDVLLIADEIQTGFGRTGRWFATEHMGFLPDILCLGKAIAGGVPMSVAALGPRIKNLTPGVHGSTFGGNPLACAAALATLDIIEEEDLVGRSAEMGSYFKERLSAIDSPLIREMRGLGLMIGVDLRVRAMPIVKQLMDEGVLVLTAGKTVLRLLPPLVITRDQIDTAVAAIETVLNNL
ncbi:MAG: aspartate aminotransferase family protein [Candidatus Promineifilaceae bacterium]|jgi:acetylornithine/LysW-gamma-L-lysine aminotransferase